MTANFAALLYLVASVLFILALRGLSSPATSRQGNMFGMVGMAIAIATTLALRPPSSLAAWLLVLLGMAWVTIGEKRFPVNTWGGMLSAGQPGGHAGGLNGISEAVLQLQHRAGERQVKGARLAVTTGYGMTMYRYGGTAAAAILERVE